MDLDFVKDIISWQGNPYILTLIFGMGFHNVMKRGQWMQNRKLLLLQGAIGALFFTGLSWSLNADYRARAIPHNVVLGAIIGWAAMGAHIYLEKYFPRLAWIVPKADDTQVLHRKDVKPCEPVDKT